MNLPRFIANPFLPSTIGVTPEAVTQYFQSHGIGVADVQIGVFPRAYPEIAVLTSEGSLYLADYGHGGGTIFNLR